MPTFLRTCLALALSQLAIVIAIATATAANDGGAELSRVNVDGTDLHYVENGVGAAVVLVHGGLADYRELSPVADALSDRYRTVVYSRRHSFPNRNSEPGAPGHMTLEVADLAGLIEALDLAPAHLAGTSYGAFIVLMLAIERPELVRTATVAEPPLLHWLHDIEGGESVYDDFHSRVMAPGRAAFATGKPEQALRIAMDYFVGPGGFDILPVEVQQMLLGNVADWQAIIAAPGALPEVSREAVAAIEPPLQILSGAESALMHRLIDPELLRTVPEAERIVLEGATHEMCVEQPASCARAIATFVGDSVDQ